MPCQVDVAPDVINQTGLPCLLHVPEGLERPAGIPGLLRAAMGVPDIPGEPLARRKAEIGGDELESVLQQLTLPHDGATAADGYGQPFVRIERDRICPLK